MDLISDPRFVPKREAEEGEGAVFDPVKKLLGAMSVEPVKDSYMVLVHVEDVDAEFAAELATTIATTYRDENLAYRRKVIRGAQGDLERLSARMGTTRDEAQDKLAEFERANKVGTLSSQRKTIDLQLEMFAKEQAETKAKLAKVNANLRELKTAEDVRDLFKVTNPEILDSTIIQRLKDQALGLRAQLAQERVNYLEKHPKVVQIKARLADVQKLGLREVTNLVQSVKHRQREYRQLLTRVKEEIATLREREFELAALELEYSWLQQSAEETKGVQAEVDRRLTETQMSEEVRTNNIWLLDAALPPNSPVRPRLRLNLLFGLLFGVLGGVGMAFLVEAADKSVKSDHDLEVLLGVPVLGLLPIVRESSDQEIDATLSVGLEPVNEDEEDYDPALVVYHRPKSQIAEFCRSTRTNLKFMTPDEPVQSMVITSSSPREGKTTVATSVAITMAMSGSKTVLVDTDMRRPRLHKIFRCKNNAGFSTGLISDVPVPEIAQKTVVPGLDLITCGPIPPNPSELLHSRRFFDLIEELRARYDYVIFDSPPVLAVTDSLILGKHVDGVLLVARIGETSKGALLQTHRRLQAIDVRVFGCILNRVDTHREDYRYYTYYYTGKYQYGEKEAAAEV